MKRILMTLFTVFACSSIYSQTYNTEEDVYNYLKANLVTADKIEGVYRYASYTQKGNETPVRVPITPVNVAIVAAGPDVFNAYWIVNGSRTINQKSFMQIKRRDYIKTYEVTFYGGEPKEVEFMEESNFRVFKEKTRQKTDEGPIESNIYYFEKTIPINAPFLSNTGPPTFPACTGALI